uniref:NADH-ubiquinone oxidoreductase chain 3 n=1 Tax=Clovia sp. EMHAU-2015-Zz052918 TaxID=2038646 RepID=A0A343K657_9HEMI|nr:NADH dehydrogenase subunit 3 [Clovia sp. EMHAU-2015-Zz052918]
MSILFVLGFLIFIFILILMFILTLISKKSFLDREKSSPFECGFDPMNSSRIPFSLHFFLMAVIFLIFDVEVVLILPIPIILDLSFVYEWFISSFMFIFILILGLYHEWFNGMLFWSN